MAHVPRSLPGGVRERGLRRVHPRVPARRLVGLRWRVEQRENARHVDRRAMQRVADKRLDIRERGQGLLTLERRRTVVRRHKLVEPCVRRHVRDPVRKDARSSDNVMHHTRRGRMQHEIEHRVAADVGRPRPGGGAVHRGVQDSLQQADERAQHMREAPHRGRSERGARRAGRMDLVQSRTGRVCACRTQRVVHLGQLRERVQALSEAEMRTARSERLDHGAQPHTLGERVRVVAQGMLRRMHDVGDHRRRQLVMRSRIHGDVHRRRVAQERQREERAQRRHIGATHRQRDHAQGPAWAEAHAGQHAARREGHSGAHERLLRHALVEDRPCKRPGIQHGPYLAAHVGYVEGGGVNASRVRQRRRFGKQARNDHAWYMLDGPHRDAPRTIGVVDSARRVGQRLEDAAQFIHAPRLTPTHVPNVERRIAQRCARRQRIERRLICGERKHQDEGAVEQARPRHGREHEVGMTCAADRVLRRPHRERRLGIHDEARQFAMQVKRELRDVHKHDRAMRIALVRHEQDRLIREGCDGHVPDVERRKHLVQRRRLIVRRKRIDAWHMEPSDVHPERRVLVRTVDKHHMANVGDEDARLLRRHPITRQTSRRHIRRWTTRRRTHVRRTALGALPHAPMIQPVQADDVAGQMRERRHGRDGNPLLERPCRDRGARCTGPDTNHAVVVRQQVGGIRDRLRIRVGHGHGRRERRRLRALALRERRRQRPRPHRLRRKR